MLPFAATCMDLEGIILSEINQRKKDKYCMTSFICDIQNIQQTNEYDKKAADSDIENKLLVTTVGVGQWGVQTSGCKIGSRVYYTTWGIQSIFCNNCKWKITFKIV